MKNNFVSAIHKKQKIYLTFNSIDGGLIIKRKCAPLDFGPCVRNELKNNGYHFWDYNSDKKNSILCLNPYQIINIEISDERFDPAEFVTWNTKTSPWQIKRNWGLYS